VQGTLDMLILKTLALEPMHGYGVGARIEQVSKRRVQGKRGISFSCIPPAGTGWFDQRPVGGDGKQPAR